MNHTLQTDIDYNGRRDDDREQDEELVDDEANEVDASEEVES